MHLTTEEPVKAIWYAWGKADAMEGHPVNLDGVPPALAAQYRRGHEEVRKQGKMHGAGRSDE